MLIRAFVAWRRGHLGGAAVPPAALEQIERSFGIVRSSIHKITEMEKAQSEQGRALSVMTEQMSALMALVRPGVPGVFRPGKSAGEILAAAGFIEVPKSFAKWFGNRLEHAGCRVEGKGHTGLTTYRLFDPDRAEAYLKNGGKAAVEMKLAERKGQGALALTGRHISVPIREIEDDLVVEGRGAVILNGEIVIIDTTTYRLDGKESAVVLNADGDMIIADVKSGHVSGNYWGEARTGQMSPEWTPKKANLRNPASDWGRATCTIIGKVLGRRAIRPRPVLAIDNGAGA